LTEGFAHVGIWLQILKKLPFRRLLICAENYKNRSNGCHNFDVRRWTKSCEFCFFVTDSVFTNSSRIVRVKARAIFFSTKNKTENDHCSFLQIQQN